VGMRQEERVLPIEGPLGCEPGRRFADDGRQSRMSSISGTARSCRSTSIRPAPAS
jgi:hypothetical protein